MDERNVRGGLNMSEKVKIYHVETQEDYDDLMVKLEKQGYRWLSGYKPTVKNCWFENQEETVICLNVVIDREMHFSSLGYTKREYPDINIIKYKAKVVKRMEKVVVPQFVAEYIEKHYGTKPDVWDKADLIRDFDMYLECYGNPSLQKWVKNDDNFLTLITAIITNDYEVEEKKYYWRKKKEYLCVFEEQGDLYLNVNKETGKLFFESKTEIGIIQTTFTETEVKQLVSEEDFNKLERVEIDDVQ